MKPEVSVITCTSDRPAAFALIQRYVLRQRRSSQWIVVDDGHTPVDPPAWTETYIRLAPQESPRESFRANMMAALEAVAADKVLFFEDDDWYHERFVDLMAGLLDLAPLVGCAHARYYNVRHRLWRIHPNAHHASLSTTGIRAELVPLALQILRDSNFSRPENPEQLDGTLWKRSGIPNHHKVLLPSSPHVVSMKSMPGKAGIGVDHRLSDIQSGRTSGGRMVYEADPDARQLRRWIGDDADWYLGLCV